MSYNLVDPTTGDLTQVAGGIDTSIIPSDASASNKLATTDSTLKTIQLSGSVDCNALTEPGLYTASAGAVSALTNAPTNAQVQLDGGFSILVTKTNTDSVYCGIQMFIPYGSDVPFIRKAYYLNGQHWTSWEQLVTTESLNYSTEETVVGKWIDGKTIYRRYLTFQLPENTAYALGEDEKRTILNLIQEDIIDTVIDAHGAVNMTNNYTVPIPYNFGYQTGGRQNICWYFQNQTKRLSINVWTNEPGYNNALGYLFIYFTKTTD